MIGHLAVFGQIVFEVGIEKVEVGTAHRNFPDAGVELAAGKLATHRNPLSVGAGNRLGGNLEEVLGVVFCHLVALRRNFLGEIAIAVEKAHRHHVHVHVAAFLEVVAGEDAKTSGINLQRGIQAVFHAEISYGGVAPALFFDHVGSELIHHGV